MSLLFVQFNELENHQHFRLILIRSSVVHNSEEPAMKAIFYVNALIIWLSLSHHMRRIQRKQCGAEGHSTIKVEVVYWSLTTYLIQATVIRLTWAMSRKVSELYSYAKYDWFSSNKKKWFFFVFRESTHIRRCCVAESNISNGHPSIAILSQFLSTWFNCWPFNWMPVKWFKPVPYRNIVYRFPNIINVCYGGNYFVLESFFFIFYDFIIFSFMMSKISYFNDTLAKFSGRQSFDCRLIWHGFDSMEMVAPARVIEPL